MCSSDLVQLEGGRESEDYTNMWKQTRLGVLLTAMVLTSLGLYGQAQQNSAPAAPKPATAEAPAVSKVDPNAAPLGVNHKVYEIGAQDILKIEVWQNQDLSRLVTIRPDGKFSLPLIGDVQAEGLTPERLEAQLEEALREQIVSPNAPNLASAINNNNRVFRRT